MKRKIRIISTFIISLSLILIIGGVTLSMLNDKDSTDNNIVVADVDISVIEDFKPCNGVKKVWIKNETKYECLIRVNIATSWIDKNNNLVIQEMPSSLAVVNFDNNWEKNWIKGNDGYYYYKKILKGNEKTEKLTDSVTFDYESELAEQYEGYRFNVDVKAEAVQPNKFDKDGKTIYAFEEMWCGMDKNVKEQLKVLIDSRSK